MSIIWDLKKIDLSSKTNNKKLFKSRKIGALLLTKSNSFNNIKSQKIVQINITSENYLSTKIVKR